MIVVWGWAVVNLYLLGRAWEILRENLASILAAENMIDFIERQDSASLPLLLDARWPPCPGPLSGSPKGPTR